MAERKVGDKLVRLVRGDITEQEVDAFVYDITEDVKLGSGYGGAISGRAGKVVQDELAAIGRCPTGTAVMTTAGRLKARYIIHANGPKFHEPDTETKLRRATQASLDLAARTGLSRLAFPPIGTGLYQVPLEVCARVMVDTVVAHLEGETSLQEVVFVAADSREYRPLEAKIQQGA